MEQHHVGMLGMHLVEHVPDGLVVVAVEPAGEGDLHAGRHQGLDLDPALGGQEVPAVYDRGGQIAMIDLRLSRHFRDGGATDFISSFE